MVKNAYSVNINITVIAKSDTEAIQKSQSIAKKLDLKHDNKAKVISIHERGFASLDSRKVNIL